MRESDFKYKQKPAYISFLIMYLLCFGISFLLIYNDPLISKKIISQIIAKLGIPRSSFFWNLPYGIIFSLPFLFYGFRRLLWNIMSIYEISSSEFRLLIGSISRKEHFFLASDFDTISLKQNLIETPFGVGSLILDSKEKGRLIIKGVYNIRTVIEVIRPNLRVSF